MPTYLVSGASGQLGRRVVELLLESKAGTVVAATRTPERLADLAKRGATVRAADFDSPRDPRCRDGRCRPRPGRLDRRPRRAGRRPRQHAAAFTAARRAGAHHIVYTSLTNPGRNRPSSSRPTTARARPRWPSGAGWTSLRNNCYTDLFLYSLPHAVRDRKSWPPPRARAKSAT